MRYLSVMAEGGETGQGCVADPSYAWLSPGWLAAGVAAELWSSQGTVPWFQVESFRFRYRSFCEARRGGQREGKRPKGGRGTPSKSQISSQIQFILAMKVIQRYKAWWELWLEGVR